MESVGGLRQIENDQPYQNIFRNLPAVRKGRADDVAYFLPSIYNSPSMSAVVRFPGAPGSAKTWL
jgi:hypothetical protein